MTPLNPCPFCGHTGDDLLDVCEPFEAGLMAYVHCTHCGADGPSQYSADDKLAAAEVARRAWNARRHG